MNYPIQRTLNVSSFDGLINFYWEIIAGLCNIKEDIEGSDGRLMYLMNLRCKLLESLSRLDQYSAGVLEDLNQLESVGDVLTHGVRFLGLSSEQIKDLFLLNEKPKDAQHLKSSLLQVIDITLASIPGRIPDAQGTQGQREVLHVLRLWSKIAEENGADIGFLAKRFEEL